MYSYSHTEFDDMDGNRGQLLTSYRIEECDRDSIVEQISQAEDETSEKLDYVTVTLMDTTTEKFTDITVYVKEWKCKDT